MHIIIYYLILFNRILQNVLFTGFSQTKYKNMKLDLTNSGDKDCYNPQI